MFCRIGKGNFGLACNNIIYESDLSRDCFRSFLYVTASPLHASGEHAADEDTHDLEDGDGDADPADDGHLVHDELLEELDTAVLVDFAQVRSRGEDLVA